MLSWTRIDLHPSNKLVYRLQKISFCLTSWKMEWVGEQFKVKVLRLWYAAK